MLLRTKILALAVPIGIASLVVLGGCSAWQPKVNTTQEAEREGKPTQIEDACLVWDKDLNKVV